MGDLADSDLAVGLPNDLFNFRREHVWVVLLVVLNGLRENWRFAIHKYYRPLGIIRDPRCQMPVLVELVLINKSELGRIDGNLPLHALAAPPFNRTQADDLNTARALAPFSAAARTFVLDYICRLIARRRGTGLSLSLPRLHELRSKPAVAELVMESFPVLFIL